MPANDYISSHPYIRKAKRWWCIHARFEQNDWTTWFGENWQCSLKIKSKLIRFTFGWKSLEKWRSPDYRFLYVCSHHDIELEPKESEKSELSFGVWRLLSVQMSLSATTFTFNSKSASNFTFNSKVTYSQNTNLISWFVDKECLILRNCMNLRSVLTLTPCCLLCLLFFRE